MAKEYTIEELEAQYNALGAEIEQRRKTEEEAKRQKLAETKAERRAEIEALEDKYKELVIAFIEDYGSYHRSCEGNDFPYPWHIFF